MAAPKGNQYGLGNSDSGRPARDLKDLAEKLRAWSKTDKATNLLGFCVEQEMSAQRLSEYAKKDAEFAEAFSEAKAAVGLRRENLLNQGKFHASAYNFNAKTYDYFGKMEAMEEEEHKAQSRAKAAKAESEANFQVQAGWMNAANNTEVSAPSLPTENNQSTQ